MPLPFTATRMKKLNGSETFSKFVLDRLNALVNSTRFACVFVRACI